MKTYAEFNQLLKTFFLNFHIKNLKKKKHNFKYLEKIKNIVNEGQHVFKFDLKDLVQNYFPKELKWLFLSNTKRFIKILKDSINEIIKEVYPSVSFFFKKKIFDKKRKNKKKINQNFDKLFQEKNSKYLKFFQIIIKPLFNDYSDPIRLLGADFIGKFVVLSGYIVDFSPVKILAKKIFFICSSCKIKISQNSNFEQFKPFIRCPRKKCNKGKSESSLYLDTNMTYFEKFQEIKISQKFCEENIIPPLHCIKVKLLGDLVIPFEIGQKVKLGGVLLPDHSFELKNRNYIENIILEAVFIEKNTGSYHIENNESTIEKKIIEMCKYGNVYKRLSSSILPFIYGNRDLKKGLLLALIGNYTNSSYLSKFGENINICIAGDPGTAKTKILKYISELTPQGIYRNLASSFKFDLFFSQNKSQTTYTITKKRFQNPFSGAGIICLDEIDKIKEKDIIFLEEILKHASWILGKEKKNNRDYENFPTIVASSCLDENFFESRIICRNEKKNMKFFFQFDLTFLTLNYMGNNFENNLAKHILFSHRFDSLLSQKKEILNKQILKGFIIESQKGFPCIPPELANFITYNYIIWKACEKEFLKNQINIRTILTILRLSFSLARLKFQNFVSRFDIKEAIRLISSSKKSFLDISNNFRLKSDIKPEYKIYFLIRNYALKHCKIDLNLAFIEKLILKKGFNREKFVSCLSYFEELKIWTISTTQGKLVFIN